MGGAYLRSRIKQAGKWDQETIVSFFLCQYCSGEYLREVKSDKSPMDVSRVLLQLSETLKDNNYKKVILSFKGGSKFMLEGDFFKETGMEYGIQNPVYTLRSLPQNVYNLDGTKAFPTWTGGLIGVLGKQMEDLTEFHKQWYINELVSGS
ncbi:hypothetical protein KAM342_43880 [Aeromonas caviae]|nr:hypothetical protein KAM342_43880 [Aeromonas caviae]GJA96530.1 hypothetical protein KAM358_43620 [Aeromonas caviae]